jgi:hypothetical protein
MRHCAVLLGPRSCTRAAAPPENGRKTRIRRTSARYLSSHARVGCAYCTSCHWLWLFVAFFSRIIAPAAGFFLRSVHRYSLVHEQAEQKRWTPAPSCSHAGGWSAKHLRKGHRPGCGGKGTVLPGIIHGKETPRSAAARGPRAQAGTEGSHKRRVPWRRTGAGSSG